MSETTFLNSITPQKLAEIIKTYFDDNELRDLCFQVHVDYEELKGQRKSDKVRELITFLHRRGQGDELIETIRRLRPHVGINLGKVLENVFLPNDPQLTGVNSLLEQLRSYYQKLYEWKELHNHLDEVINVFDQFSAQVERFAASGKAIDDINPLALSWQPVHRRVNVFLIWAEQDIKHIGKPYGLLENGTITGEKWAVEIANHHEAIKLLLAENPTLLDVQSTNQNLQLFVKLFTDRATKSSLWINWWQNLRESTRSFDNKLRNNMFLADKELRKTAMELHDFSKETLWA
jgi:hypothetical protein